jgi:hypothetical protein
MRARLGLLSCLALSIAAMALPASASAQTQEGLVNVNVSDVTVQVPIGIAANVCDVNVAVLVDRFLDTAEPCRADSTSTAVVTVTSDGPGEPFQSGLINVNVSGVDVQIPIAAALNVCDVNVAVLVDLFRDASGACEARARGRARA